MKVAKKVMIFPIVTASLHIKLFIYLFIRRNRIFRYTINNKSVVSYSPEMQSKETEKKTP